MKGCIHLFLAFFVLSTAQAQLQVASGETVKAASADEVRLFENLQNNGTVERITLAGTSALSITGTGTINHLKLDKSSGTASIASDMQSLTGTLDLTAGSLAAGGRLTLKSNSSGTAQVIVHATTGTITGNVVVERWINSASGTRTRQWRMLGFPYSTAVTLSTIGGMAIQVVGSNLSMIYFNEPGADASSGSGARNAGYQSFTALDQQIASGQGVMAWLYGTSGTASGGVLSADLTITSSGTLNENGNAVIIPLSFTSTNANPGWNLVANPYASSIDWKKIVRSSSVENTVYRWNPASASFTTRNTEGVSTGDGAADDIIESGAAFFVRASATGQSLTIPQSAKTGTATTFSHYGRAPFRLDMPSERTPIGVSRLAGLRVKATGQGNPSPDDIYIDVSRADATAGYDPQYDAESMVRTSGTDLSVKDRDGKVCAVQFDAPIKEAGIERRYYPLGVTTPAVGQTRLEISTEGEWNPLNSISLIDTKEGKTYLLQGGTLSHSFNMSSLKEEDRFILAVNHVAVDKNGGMPGKQLRLMGNPVTSEKIDLLLAHPTARPKRWQLNSMQGVKVAEGRFDVTDGNVQYGLNAPGMRAAGVYVLRVELDNGEVQTVQVIRK